MTSIVRACYHSSQPNVKMGNLFGCWVHRWWSYHKVHEPASQNRTTNEFQPMQIMSKATSRHCHGSATMYCFRNVSTTIHQTMCQTKVPSGSQSDGVPFVLRSARDWIDRKCVHESPQCMRSWSFWSLTCIHYCHCCWSVRTKCGIDPTSCGFLRSRVKLNLVRNSRIILPLFTILFKWAAIHIETKPCVFGFPLIMFYRTIRIQYWKPVFIAIRFETFPFHLRIMRSMLWGNHVFDSIGCHETQSNIQRKRIKQMARVCVQQQWAGGLVAEETTTIKPNNGEKTLHDAITLESIIRASIQHSNHHEIMIIFHFASSNFCFAIIASAFECSMHCIIGYHSSSHMFHH